MPRILYTDSSCRYIKIFINGIEFTKVTKEQNLKMSYITSWKQQITPPSEHNPKRVIYRTSL